MVREGLFAGAPEDVVFKGGTAIRKYRLGRRGRFSTDLDFAVAQDAYGEHVIVALQQGLIEVDNVHFESRSVDLPAAKATWVATVDGLGTTMSSKLGFTRRPTLLPPIVPGGRPEIGGITPDLLGFELPLVPLMRLEENLAEKSPGSDGSSGRGTCTTSRRWATGTERSSTSSARSSVSRSIWTSCATVGRARCRSGEARSSSVGRSRRWSTRRTWASSFGGRVEYGPMLERIGDDFGPMGTPQGTIETRLASVNRGDLYWAEGEYIRLRSEYRVAPPAGDGGFAVT